MREVAYMKWYQSQSIDAGGGIWLQPEAAEWIKKIAPETVNDVVLYLTFEPAPVERIGFQYVGDRHHEALIQCVRIMGGDKIATNGRVDICSVGRSRYFIFQTNIREEVLKPSEIDWR